MTNVPCQSAGRPLTFIAGLVDGTGTASVTFSTQPITLTDNGTGDYTLAWSPGFANPSGVATTPLIMFSDANAVGTSANLTCNTVLANTTASQVNFNFKSDAGAATDTKFTFLIAGYLDPF